MRLARALTLMLRRVRPALVLVLVFSCSNGGSVVAGTYLFDVDANDRCITPTGATVHKAEVYDDGSSDAASLTFGDQCPGTVAFSGCTMSFDIVCLRTLGGTDVFRGDIDVCGGDSETTIEMPGGGGQQYLPCLGVFPMSVTYIPPPE